jgi:hypothetical protein
MKRLPIASVMAIFAASGAALSSPPEKHPPKVAVPAPAAATFVGTYNLDQSLLRHNLTLNPDGIYVATATLCSFPNGAAVGNWRVTGKTLILSPFTETDVMKGYLRSMDVVNEGDRFILLRPEDRASLNAESDNVLYFFILHLWSFQRTDQMPKHKAVQGLARDFSAAATVPMANSRTMTSTAMMGHHGRDHSR